MKHKVTETMAEARWYTVQTKPRAERQAKEALLHNGVAVYLPLVKVARVNPRARPVVPLFPGYLFVQADLDQVGQSAINWVPGVVRLVNFGGEPVAVPDAVIEHIKQKWKRAASLAWGHSGTATRCGSQPVHSKTSTPCSISDSLPEGERVCSSSSWAASQPPRWTWTR
jgi:transcription antitermination factor NusG